MSEHASGIVVEGLGVTSHVEGKPILRDVRFSIGPHELVSIVGPNGCGKSTLLNALADEACRIPHRLDVRWSGSAMIGTGRGSVGYVPQDYRNSLLPWLSARRNVSLASDMNKTASDGEGISDLIGGNPIVLDWEAYPYQLSGGQAQCVAVLRSLHSMPTVLLLDEPFASLDIHNSLALMEYVVSLCEARRTCGIIVSHNLDEAVFVSDRILVMSQAPGRIVAEVLNPLPRPRSLGQLGSDAFRDCKQLVLRDLLTVLNRTLA